MELTVSEHAHTFKRLTFRSWVFEIDVSGPLRNSLVDCAHLQRHFILRDLLNWSYYMPLSIRVDNFPLKILLKLEVIDLYQVEILIELVATKHAWLCTLII